MENWGSPSIENRHRLNHLRVATAFYFVWHHVAKACRELCHCSVLSKVQLWEWRKTMLMDWLLEWPCSLCIGGEEAGEKPQSVDAVQPS